VTRLFLHGLDSSGSGTKGRYFSEHFPDMLRPDFEGTLSERMAQLNRVVHGKDELVLVGSSFGGLMAACQAQQHPGNCKRIIMLAPALNFHEHRPPEIKLDVESILVIGSSDVVTPPDLVLPAAKATFANLRISVVDDDHLLHETFQYLDWPALLG
jgi:pimeloyl-ACP methyl ester carboxylesterase